MLTVMIQNENQFDGDVESQIPKDIYVKALHDTVPLAVMADGPELGRCNMILTHGRTDQCNFAGNSGAVFIADEARKIVLNWLIP